MDVTFNCDKCGQHIVIDEAGAGLQVQCPTCRAPLSVPKSNTESETSLLPTGSQPSEIQTETAQNCKPSFQNTSRDETMINELTLQRIEQKRQDSIKTGVTLLKLLTPEEAAFLQEYRRQKVNAKARQQYAAHRTEEIAKTIQKQKTPEGKAARLFFNTLNRARRWKDNKLEAMLLEEKTQKGKAALVDVPAIMRKLGRGRKWREKPPPQPPKLKAERKKPQSKFSRLTRETIFERTKGGETALHRAIVANKFELVPKEALSLEIFLAQNEVGKTPMHYAARYGCLNLIPRTFLTHQTLSARTIWGITPIHIAAEHEHLDQIPGDLLSDGLMMLKNNFGETPQKIIEWKSRPATDNQLAFLADLGVNPPAGITVTQASKLIEETLPRVPATAKYIEKLKRLGFDGKAAEGMTAAEAKTKIAELSWQPPTNDQLKRFQNIGIMIPSLGDFYAGTLDEILKLADRPPSTEQLSNLRKLDATLIDYAKTELDALLIVELAKTFRRCRPSLKINKIGRACKFAVSDLDFRKPSLHSNVGVNADLTKGSMFFEWPKEKIQKWLRVVIRNPEEEDPLLIESEMMLDRDKQDRYLEISELQNTLDDWLDLRLGCIDFKIAKLIMEELDNQKLKWDDSSARKELERLVFKYCPIAFRDYCPNGLHVQVGTQSIDLPRYKSMEKICRQIERIIKKRIGVLLASKVKIKVTHPGFGKFEFDLKGEDDDAVKAVGNILGLATHPL